MSLMHDKFVVSFQGFTLSDVWEHSLLMANQGLVILSNTECLIVGFDLQIRLRLSVVANFQLYS